jgi:uncharacterized protein
MSSRLPEYVDPWRLADREDCISGTVPLSEFTRLGSVLLSDDGEAVFRLDFSRDAKRRARITGAVSATLAVECQRCLKALELLVDAEINLAVIEVPEEAERIPGECDPVQAEDGLVHLLDMIEDELILAIPQVPMHEPDKCAVDYGSPVPDEVPELSPSSETAEDNPFAVLARLKSKHDK